MNCISPKRIYKNLNRQDFPDGLVVPCGKCINCRIKKRSEWNLRLLHEMAYHKNNIYLTLTYDNKKLPCPPPEYLSLRKEHLQKFFKRLRKRLQNKNIYQELDEYIATGDFNRKIKYFASGEYGDERNRPHYHCIIFGIGLSDFDKSLIVACWPYANWFQRTRGNRTILDCSIGMVEKDSINYVGKYIFDKLDGQLAEEEYLKKNIKPVFKVCSNGLGKWFALENYRSILHFKKLTMNGKNVSIPRYYINKLKIDSSYLKEYSIISESEKVEKFSGLNTTREAYYKTQEPIEVLKLEKAIKDYNKQIARNNISRQTVKKLRKEVGTRY